MSRGRTPVFRMLMQAMRTAHWLNKNPDKRSWFFEAREVSRVSRRDFLRMLGAAGLVTAAGGIVRPAEAKPPAGKGESLDAVAILGAGTAGLTAAYRLWQAGVRCEIFEASERVGGRMWTKYDFNDEKMFCELGGELVDTDHRDLVQLAAELGIEIQELKAGDKGVDLYFFEGKHFSDKELIPLFRPFARRLAADLSGIYDANEEFTEKAAKFDQMNLAEYLAKTGVGVEKWVIDMLRVAYVIEYGREAEEQSAINLISYLGSDTTNGFKIFGESDESKRIKGGSSALPNALAKAIADKVPIHQDHRLVRMARSGSNLSFDFVTGGGTKTVKFSRAICALPFTTLRLVEGLKEIGLSKIKQTAIAELGYGNNIKVMYGFAGRFWRQADLPLPAPSNGSILTDLPLQCTWETSRSQSGQSGILTNFLGGRAAKEFTPGRFGKFPAELNRIFPGIDQKFDGKRALMVWPEYKFARGSYTCPLVGQNTTLLQMASESELNGRLVFAGEHTSKNFSGYMNGAVESGNRAAKEILDPGKNALPQAA